MYLANPDRYRDMLYRRCGASGILLPAISIGLWHNFGGVDTLENGRAMLRRAFDLGITHFDLANNYLPPYGSAKENFGLLFKQDWTPYRDELIISTKAGYDMWPGPYGNFGSRKYLLASLDQSLKRMGVDYVDIFYSHRPDPDTPVEETMSALDQAVRSDLQSALRGHLQLRRRAYRQGRRNPAPPGDAVPDPPDEVLDVCALERRRVVGAIEDRWHWRHSLQSVGARSVER